MSDLIQPKPTEFHQAMRLAAIVRYAVVGQANQSWQTKQIPMRWYDGTFCSFYDEYWEKWTDEEKTEVIRRWTIYKLTN